MYDYDGDFKHWQDKLDVAGVDFDITNLAGATFNEIDGLVNWLLEREKDLRKENNS